MTHRWAVGWAGGACWRSPLAAPAPADVFHMQAGSRACAKLRTTRTASEAGGGDGVEGSEGESGGEGGGEGACE